MSSDKNKSDNLPAKKDTKDYFIDVSEIESNKNTAWDFEGTLIVEHTQKSDRFSYPEIEFPTAGLISKYHSSYFAKAFQINKSIEFTIDAFLYKIPETRAGPVC